jgi:hypothetical protein
VTADPWPRPVNEDPRLSRVGTGRSADRWPRVSLEREALARVVITAVGMVAAVVAAVACIDAVVAFDARYRAHGQPAFVDWLTYANAFDRFVQGEELYARRQLAGPYLLPRLVTTGYAYPPPSIVLFAPFSPRPEGLIAWLLFNAAVLWSAVTALAHRALGVPVVWAAAGTAASLVPFVPLASGLATGNVNVALAGLTGWAWVAQGRAWVGPAAGLSGIVKLYPGSLAIWAARWDGWRAVWAAAAVGAVLVVLTLPFVGLDSWPDYVTALQNSQPACWPGTASVACVAAPALGIGGGKLLGILLGVALVLVSLRIRNPFVAFVTISVGMLAPVTDGWIHYGLFAYVLMLVGADHVMGRHRRRARR